VDQKGKVERAVPIAKESPMLLEQQTEKKGKATTRNGRGGYEASKWEKKSRIGT